MRNANRAVLFLTIWLLSTQTAYPACSPGDRCVAPNGITACATYSDFELLNSIPYTDSEARTKLIASKRCIEIPASDLIYYVLDGMHGTRALKVRPHGFTETVWVSSHSLLSIWDLERKQEEERRRKVSAESAKNFAETKKKYIEANIVCAGMNPSEVESAWGKPSEQVVTRTNVDHLRKTIWIWNPDGSYVVFKNGFVTEVHSAIPPTGK